MSAPVKIFIVPLKAHPLQFHAFLARYERDIRAFMKKDEDDLELELGDLKPNAFDLEKIQEIKQIEELPPVQKWEWDNYFPINTLGESGYDDHYQHSTIDIINLGNIKKTRKRYRF